MHKHDVKRGGVVIVVFLILINCAYNIQAFGVSTTYLENETLQVIQGKNYEYIITIQNGDDNNYYVDIAYASTKNIAKLRNTSHLIPSNTYNNVFYFDITIPTDAKIGDKYVLDYSAKPRINGSDVVAIGVEIKRSINILVIDTETNTQTKDHTNNQDVKIINNTVLQNIKAGALAIFIFILATIIVVRVWKLSKGISSRFSNNKVTDYTLSEASSLKDVKKLLEKMNDDEFNLPEIKKIFKEKVAELTTHHLMQEIKHMSRRQAISALNKIVR